MFASARQHSSCSFADEGWAFIAAQTRSGAASGLAAATSSCVRFSRSASRAAATDESHPPPPPPPLASALFVEVEPRVAEVVEREHAEDLEPLVAEVLAHRARDHAARAGGGELLGGGGVLGEVREGGAPLLQHDAALAVAPHRGEAASPPPAS